MLDIATFEQDVQKEADGRIADVIEGLLDRLLEIPEVEVTGCSYAAYHRIYVGTKLLIRKLGFDLEFYWEAPSLRRDVPLGYTTVPLSQDDPNGKFIIKRDTSPSSQIRRRIQEFMPRMEEAHTKMYANPCKTCTTCQTRRKPWPIK